MAEVSQPTYSRARSMGLLREVIYLDSPVFVKSRAKTLGPLLKESQGRSGGPSSKGLRQRKIEKETQPSLKSKTKTKSIRARLTRAETLDTLREADPEANTYQKPKAPQANSLKDLMKNESDGHHPQLSNFQENKKLASA